MITTACHPVPNGPNTNDSTIISKTTMQSGIQRNPTITATIDPELIKVIRTSHDAIQQQIEAIQTTLQTMITVLNRNILPPQTTELPSADRPISEISPTPDRTTVDTPKLLLLFDLANSGQSPHTEIDAPALPLKHSEPQYRDYYLPLSLLPTRRARRHWFPLHQTHQRTSALSSEICLLPTPFPTILLRHNDLSMHQAANTDLLRKQSSYDFYYIHKYGTDCTLQLCTFYRPISTAPMMIQPLRNDPTIRLRHYWYQYYTQAPLLPYEPNPTKTDYIAPACQSGWHLNGPTAADYQPTRSKRSTHCDDYTTVLSSIPWNLLPHQQQPILTPNPTGIAVDMTTKYQVLHTPDSSTATTRPIHEDQPSGLKSYSKIVRFVTVASSLAYLPALTTKFKGWIRIWPICYFSQHCSVPPRPATSDKNLLRPP